MAKHGVELNTLKDCFQFLKWLNGPNGQKNNVATAFVQKLRPYYEFKPQFKWPLQTQYTKFLTNVSALYNILSSNKKTTLGTYKIKANDIVESLLECTPKLLAALSFMQYHVDTAFSNVGGGDWASQSLRIGELGNFLTSGNNILEGGFAAEELSNVQGSALANDLRKILNKEYDARGNPVHDHFRNVILTTLAKPLDAVNTGNAVFLLPLFCTVVLEDSGGTKYKSFMEKGIEPNTICWEDLKNHCKILSEHIDKLMRAGFSATGRAFKPKQLVKFATEATEWFRANLLSTADVLKRMIPQSIRSQMTELRSFANDKLYPNGFIFDASNNSMWPKLNKLDEWNPIFQKFLLLDEMLRKLKTILDGYKCGANPVVTKAEAAKPTATKTEATKTGATKTEAAKPAAPKAGGTPKQTKSLGGGDAQNSPGKNTAAASSPGGAGASGPAGTKGANGNKGSSGSKQKDQPQTGKNAVQHLPPPSQQPSSQPPQASPPGTPAAPGSTGQPSSGGKSTNGGGGAGKKAAGSAQPGQPQTTGVALPSAPSSVASGNNGGQGLSGAGLAGKQGKGAPGGVTTGTQPGAAQSPAPPQDPGVQAPGSSSSGAPSTGGVPGLASGAGQQNVNDQGSHGGGSTGQKTAVSPSPVQPSTLGGATQVPQSSSAPVSSSGKGQSGQAATSGAGQSNGQAPQGDQVISGPKSTVSSGASGVPSTAGDTNRCSGGKAPVDLWPYGFKYCPRDGKPWDDSAQEQMHDDWDKKLEKARKGVEERQRRAEERLRRQREAEAIKTEYERQLQLQRPDILPSIEVVYKSQEFSENLEKAYHTAALNHRDAVAPNVSLKISGTTGSYANSHDTVATVDDIEPLAFDVVKPEPLDVGKYVVFDIVKPDLPEDNKPAVSDLYKSVALAVKGKTEADGFTDSVATVLDGQDVQDSHHPILPNQQEFEKLEMYAQQGNNILTGTHTADSKGHQRPMSHPIFQASGYALKPKKSALLFPPLPQKLSIPATPTEPDGFALTKKPRPTKPPLITPKVIPPLTGQLDVLPMENSTDFSGTPIVQTPTHIPTVYIPQDSAFETFVPSEPTGDPIPDPKTKAPRKSLTPVEIEAHPGVMIDEPICQLYSPLLVTKKVPSTDHSVAPPRTVREMLCWLSDLPHALGYANLIKHLVNLFERSESIEATPESISPEDVTEALSQTSGHASSVLAGIEGPVPIDLNKLHYERYGAPLMYYSEDTYTLLCQLLSYVYATYHQLSFLRTQCRRDSKQGGWRDCQFGKYVEASYSWQCTKDPLDPMKLQGHGCDPSPLQGFLTDQSYLSTYWYQRNDVCRRSRIKMGFLQKHLRDKHKHGFYIYNLLTGACYNNVDPLEKLCRYLVCLTRRTPRTTGELVSFFHNFGVELHGYASKALSSLGTALSTSHSDCPDWDRLDGTCLGAVRGIRGQESLNIISNNNHDNEHPRTLSTLVGCGSDATICPPHCSPITYRAYALYSQSFAHTYLGWTVYLPDRLHDSLEKLRYDFKRHVSTKCASLYLCSTALPLLYTHGITPPEGQSQSKLTCQQVTEKLQEIVNGQPIATLMTAMDNFLYGIREPFIFTLVALWSLAFLIFANTMLYRLDVLYIRSHLIRTEASHRIDVKALLTKGRKMLSLYKDVDYFDEDPIGQLSF